MNKKTEVLSNPKMGKRVEQTRGALTQKEFGKIVGVSQGNIAKIEHGMVPRANILLRIAQVGGASVEGLLEGEKAKKKLVGKEGPTQDNSELLKIKQLEKTLEDKEKIINLLEAEIHRLKEENSLLKQK